MKKVLIFSLSYFPRHVGGAEMAIKEITDRIHDIEFHLIALRYDSSIPIESKEGRVFVRRIGWAGSGVTVAQTFSPFFYLAKIFYAPLAAIAAYRLNRREHFDGFWAVMSYMQLPIVLLRFCGLRVPYAVTLQDGDAFRHVFGRWYIMPVRPLLRYGFKHAAVVQVISKYLAGWARAMGRDDGVEIIPNAADVARFSQVYPRFILDEIKDRLDKKMGDVFIVTASRLVYKNAVDDVIRALPHLPENVHFVILGDGPDEDMLRKIAKDLGVSERVRFMGHIDNAELPKYLQTSDIFIRPSRTEGFGVSFSEAMAAGLPVIATQEGGIADFLFDEKRNPDQPITGWAVDKNSPDQIAEAVKNIIANPEKMRAVVRTARQMVFEKYDWDIVAKDMREKIFRPVLGV